jgi:hypothetical protein
MTHDQIVKPLVEIVECGASPSMRGLAGKIIEGWNDGM